MSNYTGVTGLRINFRGKIATDMTRNGLRQHSGSTGYTLNKEHETTYKIYGQFTMQNDRKGRVGKTGDKIYSD